jgi:hypothetical protein
MTDNINILRIYTSYVTLRGCIITKMPRNAKIHKSHTNAFLMDSMLNIRLCS